MGRRKSIALSTDRQIKAAIVLFLVLVLVASRTVEPLWGLSLHLSAFLWWVVTIAVSWGQGTILLRVLRFEDSKLAQEVRVALVTGLGLGALSLEVFLMGLAGFYSTRAITALVLVALLTVSPVLWRNIRGRWPHIE